MRRFNSFTVLPVLSVFLFSVFFIIPNFAKASVNPSAYWKFDEATTGVSILDSSSNGNNGSVTGDTPLPASSYPPLKNISDTESLSFDGNTSISVVDSPSINFASSFTIAFWINPSAWNDGASRGIVSKFDSGSSKGFIIYDDGSSSCGGSCGPLMNLRIHGADSVGEYLYSNSSVDVGTWQHWAVVYDAGAQTVVWYKNGVVDATYTSVSFGDATNSAPLTLGYSQPWSGYFQGSMDEVRTYQSALSADDVVSLAALSVAGYESSDATVSTSSPGTAHTPANVGSEDGNYWTTALSTSNSGYDTQVYKFSPDLAGVTTPQFGVNWFGHGATPSDKNVYLSIWNNLSSAWEQLNSNHCDTDCALTGNKTGADYKDNNGSVWVMAKADNYAPAISISNVSFNGTNNISWNSNIPGTSEVVYDSVPHDTWQQFLDNGQNGNGPYGSLININGIFYGITHSGGANDYGTVFSFNPTGNVLTKIHDFDYNSDGGSPYGGLTNIGGVLYGTTYYGGAHGYGTAFSIDTTNNNQFTDLHDFRCGTDDGCYSFSTLTNIGGVLYGMTAQGGANSCGIIFSIDTTNNNTFAKLHDFNSVTDGGNPYGSFANIGGILYGTAYIGGSASYGTVFSFNLTGNILTDIHDFDSTHGRWPYFSTPINVNGVLYGMTYYGGSNSNGTVFTIDTTNNNQFTDIHDFYYPVDGAFPLGSLVNVGGIVYGLTQTASNNYGTLFSIDTTNSNNFSSVHVFNQIDGGSTGSYLLNVGGVIYGLSTSDGANGAGTIFSLDTTNGNAFSKLYDFVGNTSGHLVDNSLVTSHSRNESVHTSTFYFMVRSTDTNGNTATSTIQGPYVSSCPFVWTYDGEKYNFIVDASAAAGLGAGLKLATWATTPWYKSPNANNNYPDPLSYVKISGDELKPRTVGGETYYDVKNTTELNETNYYDQASLEVVDHDASVDVYPDYRNNGVIHTISKDAPAPISVIDQSGNDVTSLVTHDDGIYYHTSTSSVSDYIDIKLSNSSTTPVNLKLLIKRGKEGTFSGGNGSDGFQYKSSNGSFVNLPANMDPITVTRAGASHASRNLINTYGTETSVIDLSGLTIRDNTVRLITTSGSRFWDIDWLAVDTNPDSSISTTTLSPYYADLHHRGISQMYLVNPFDPNMSLTQPKYDELTNTFVSNPVYGMATRYGDVAPLLQTADDKFVVMVQGDELSMKYSVPAQASNTVRDFVFETWDYHKPYANALGDTIAPLPFNEMTQYPYHTNVENYPNDADHRLYQDTYNTRLVNLPVVPAHHSLNTDQVTLSVSDVSVPTPPPTPPQTQSSQSGGSVSSQVANLRSMGNNVLADQLIKQYPNLFNRGTYQFPRSLRFGMNGVDVKALQKFLNNNGFALATTGPGSPGHETTLFSSKTKTALMRFQAAHRSDIVTPAGLTSPSGVFAQFTRSYINRASVIESWKP